MRLRRVWIPPLIAFACSATLLASNADAQVQNAAISGVVRDPAGAPVPNVRVETSSSRASEQQRTAVSDRQGVFKITELPPGTYTVTFVHPEFATLKYERIELPGSFMATVNVAMRPGRVEEVISLDASAPRIDTQTVTQRATTSRQLMDDLPSDRNYISFAAMTPGIVVVGGVHNVGGSIPESALMLRIHGSRVGESRLFVDGMSVMSGNSAGGVNYGNFLNNAMAEAVVVNTDALSAEFELSGVTSNFLTRRGSDRFLGSFIGRYTNTSLQSENLSADLISRGLTSSNRLKRIWDANPAVSGPLLDGRAWLFASVRNWGTYNYIAGLYEEVDPTALVRTEDLSRPAVQPVWHVSGDARVTVQPARSHTVNVYHHSQVSDFGTCLNPTRLTAPSGCPHNRNDPQWFSQASWQSPVSSRLFLEAGGTITVQKSGGRRDPQTSTTLPAITEASTQVRWRAPSDGYGGSRNNQSNYRGAISYTTGTHGLKVGFTLIRMWRVTSSEHNGSVNYTFLNGLPNELTQFAEPAVLAERVNYNLGLYAQDQWTIDRLTLNVGVRADFLNARVEDQSVPAGLLIGARHFDAVHNVPDWRDLSPRLGAAYDLFGDGRTAIKATLSRYVQSEAYAIARTVNPLQSTVLSATRSWDDRRYLEGDPRRGNFAPDCDLTIVAANGECGPATPNTFGQTIVTTRYDEAITEGFGVRPYNWGTSVSVQHEPFRGVTVYGGYFRRWFGNFSVTRNLAVANADFSPYCVTAPLDPKLPGGGGNRICGFYDVSVAKIGDTNNLITAADGFGRQEDVFDGFDLTVNARLPRGAFVNGGVGVGRQRTDNCYVLDDLSISVMAGLPRAKPFCDVRPPMQVNGKAQVVYPLPWWGVQMSAAFQSLPGPQLLAQRRTTNAEIAPDLGRNLSSCVPGSTCTASVLLDLVPPGTMFGDRINQLDLRVSRTIRAGRTTIRPTISIYNLLNANPVLQYNNRYNATWPAPNTVLTARFADVGVQVDF